MEISGAESIDSDVVSFSGYLKQESATSRKVHPLFVIVCAYPIILDALLLYIPIIDEDAKCVTLDKNLKKMVLVYILVGIVLIVFAIRTWRGADRADKETWVLITIILPLAITAALPIPQIAILVLLPRMKGSKLMDRMKILNSLIVFQYVLRVYPFYRFCKNQNTERLYKSNRTKSYWVLGAINFVMYITACHVLGAFWYFYSLQREIDCWTHACKSENGCEFGTLLDCNEYKTFRNVTLLNNLCPINPSNATVFDFGIYLDALQSGMMGSRNFPQKFLQCFSWGLRNLSSFGSNLKTSNYAWENFFVAFISISSLLLFIYLLGHLQTFMQATNKSVGLYWKTWPQIRLMLSEYDLPDYMDSVIWRMVRDKLEDDKYYVENIFSHLSEKLKRDIKLHLFLPSLKKSFDLSCQIRSFKTDLTAEIKTSHFKKVTMLEPMDKQLLKEICEHLEPMNFNGINYIIRQGEPLDMMFFVLQGTVITYTTNHDGSSSTSCLEKRDYYGERLLNWAAVSTSFSGVPISPRTVKSHKKAEVFAITATELQLVVSKFSSTNLPGSSSNTRMEIAIDDS